jgi:hypothetical protein
VRTIDHDANHKRIKIQKEIKENKKNRIEQAGAEKG